MSGPATSLLAAAVAQTMEQGTPDEAMYAREVARGRHVPVPALARSSKT